MKLPKTRKKLCPTCKKHTEHKITLAKKRTMGTAHPLGVGGKKRTKIRGGRRGIGNHGRFSKPPGGGKMTGKKQTKKSDLRYTCSVCKKTHVQKKGFRSRRIEFQ